MFGIPNHNIIFAVFVIDILLSLFIGYALDWKDQDAPKEYAELLGCGCIGPLIFAFNLVGIGLLLLMNAIGILGPWWTWALGLGTPIGILILIIYNENRTKRIIK